MMRKLYIVVLISVVFFLLPLSISHAENAEVLPKGVMRMELKSFFYSPVDERYNDNGDAEDLATDFNANLNSSVFPDLSLVEIGFGMPVGSASVGNSVVSFEFEASELEINAQYGVTDRMSLGIKVPYRFIKNDVATQLDTSSATVGLNPFVPGGVAPLAVPGTVPFTADDVQNLLAQNYGFKRVETWSDNGILDIEAGLRYQYLKSDSWRLAFTGGVRFPTGETDDPDNLADFPFGTGAYALLFRFNNDYTRIKNTLLNLTLKYDLYLPDKEVLRVPDDVNQPITPNKEEVDRDLGDIIEINASATYQFLKGASGFLQYVYAYKLKDSISGDLGYAYEQLETESDQKQHVLKVGLSYSTIPLYQEKKFSVPLNAYVAYRNRFAGKNILKSQYIELGVAVYF